LTPKLEVFLKFRENDGFTITNDFLTNLDQKQSLLSVNSSGKHFYKKPSEKSGLSAVFSPSCLVIFGAKTFISWYRAGFGSLNIGHPPGQETPQYGEFLMSRCRCDIAIRSKDRIGGRSVKQARPQGQETPQLQYRL
jgi:hypothetical protein